MEKNIFKDRRERLTNVIPNNSALILKGAESKHRIQILLMPLDRTAVFIIFQVFLSPHL